MRKCVCVEYLSKRSPMEEEKKNALNRNKEDMGVRHVIGVHILHVSICELRGGEKEYNDDVHKNLTHCE
jgi:hypothetical protein